METAAAAISREICNKMQMCQNGNGNGFLSGAQVNKKQTKKQQGGTERERERWREREGGREEERRRSEQNSSALHLAQHYRQLKLPQTQLRSNV